MKFKKLYSGMLASAMFMTSGVAFANEVAIEKIKEIEDTVEIKETAPLKEKAVTRESYSKMKGINYSAARTSNPEFVFGETVNIEIPKYGGYSGDVNITSKGILSISASIPAELKASNDYIWIYVYDEDGEVVERRSFKSGDWDGQSNFICRLGFNPGKYTIEISSGYGGILYSNVNVSFQSYSNTEVEDNDTEEKANEIVLGTAYKGSLNRYDYDVFKITVANDTKVKVYYKENSSLGKKDKSTIKVKLSNQKTEYAYDNYEGIASMDVILKKGVNYIEIYNDALLTDYAIKVSKITGPFAPKVDTVGDNYDYVTGSTEKGTKVYIKVGSRAYAQATVSSSGYFRLKTGKIKEGTLVSVYAQDSKGQKSSVVKTKSVDKTPPSKLSIDKFTVKSTKVTGATDPKTTVVCRIDGDNALVFETKSDSKGKYSFVVGNLSRGTKIEVQASDNNKNYTPIKETKVQNYVKAPKVNNFSNINVNVTGTGAKGTTVYVKAGSKYYKGAVNSAGKFSIKIPKQKYKTVLKVYAKDKSGDTSVVVSKTVGYAPKKPVVNAVSTKSVKITGKSSKNAKITVKIGSKYYTGKTTSKGNFSIKIPKCKKGTSIKVQAKFESNGLKSYATTVKVK